MKWLLLVFSVILFSPLSAGSWDRSASLHHDSDTLLVAGIDCFESSFAECDDDSDDANTSAGTLLTTRYSDAHFFSSTPGYTAFSRLHDTIRAPPQV